MGSLYIIPAQHCPVALILRRGPSRWYHLIAWNMRRDEFTRGAWFKGNIYEERCDLSPDGKLFIYFVSKFTGKRDYTHAWTAISRPPWLHALALWPQGTTYGGGGRFSGPLQYWGPSPQDSHPDFPVAPNRLLTDGVKPEPRPRLNLVADADWSGHDHRGAVIYSKQHLLYRRSGESDHLVGDFTDLTPDPQPAPKWAREPI